MTAHAIVQAAAAPGASDAALRALAGAASARPDEVRAALEAAPDLVIDLFGPVKRRRDALGFDLGAALAGTAAEPVIDYVVREFFTLRIPPGLLAALLPAAERAGWLDRLRPAVTDFVHRSFGGMVRSVTHDGRGATVEGQARTLADAIASFPPLLRDQAIWAVRGASNQTYEGERPETGTDLRWMSELVLQRLAVK